MRFTRRYICVSLSAWHSFFTGVGGRAIRLRPWRFWYDIPPIGNDQGALRDSSVCVRRGDLRVFGCDRLPFIDPGLKVCLVLAELYPV